MPFNLCKSEKKRLNELFDHVKELSDTVDELREEVNAMKICSIVASKETQAKRRNRSESSTLHKLKKCLENNLSPVFSRDPTYRVRKKCQQMFSQFPTIISNPTHVLNNKSINEHFPSSYSKANSRSVNCKISASRYMDENKPKRREEEIQFPLKHRKHITKDYQKTESSQVSSFSSNSSENSLIDHYKSYHPHCTYDTCNSLKSPKIENSRKLRENIPKKKTTGTTTSALTSPIGIDKRKNRILEPETIKHQRSVTFVDKKKNIALEKGSSVSSSISSSNACGHHLQDCSTIYSKPKSDIKKIVNTASSEPKKKKKRSNSAQCSIDCEYLDRLRSHKKDVCTSTLSHNLSRDNRSIIINNSKKGRKKSLASQETQTSLKSVHKEKMCFDRRRQYCPMAKRSRFSAGSLNSLTSCSPRSISSFCLGSEELGEGLMHRYYKREAIPVDKERFEKKRKTEVLEKNNENVEREKLFSFREIFKKDANDKNTKPRRKKRTYVISSDIPMRKTGEIRQCNFCEEQENSSFIGDSTFQEKNIIQRKRRKKWKKPEVLSKVSEGHQLWNKQEASPEKHNNYVSTTICTNRQTDRFFPKLERLSNWKIQRQKKPVKLTKFCESTSSSSRACTDETCSLTSEPPLSRSDGSLTSNTFERRTDKGL